MQRLKNKKLILLALGICTPLTFTTSKVNASSFGSDIFCSMRDAGNDHESSWDAAYSYIKKQKGGIFKISPKNAAAQITETVIREKEKFSYCLEYLDQLHPNRKLIRDLEKEAKRKEKEAKDREKKRKELEKELEKTNNEVSEEFTDETLDRYSY
ncbi:secretion system protein [Prochlorococcus sp. AH-736-B20]|nr:secretion system protein [Prochlorococcus sp. AH-736-B20]